MPYDPARKLLSAHPRMAEDLLRGFVAKRWSHALDFRTLELRPAASVSDDLRRREGDLLWRVRLGGTWLSVNRSMPQRVSSKRLRIEVVPAPGDRPQPLEQKVEVVLVVGEVDLRTLTMMSGAPL